jgi:hypothetical protein
MEEAHSAALREASGPVSYIALRLPEAMAAAEARQERVARVLVTGPPGGGKGEGVPRVVRERRGAEGLELTVAFPSARPPAREEAH